jgi:DNA/RNA-binding protein KIN17
MLGSGTKVRLDQAHLETVIPAVGRRVKIVNGAYRGSEANMKGLNEKSFSVSLEIASGVLKGRHLDNIAYEDVSKLHQA